MFYRVSRCQIIFFICFSFQMLFSELYITFNTSELVRNEDSYYYRQRFSRQLLNFFAAYKCSKLLDASLVLMPMDIDLFEVTRKRRKCIDFSEFYNIKKFKKIKNLGPYLKKPHSFLPNESYVFTLDKNNPLRDFISINQLSLKHEFRQLLLDACPSFSTPSPNEKLQVAVHIRTGQDSEIIPNTNVLDQPTDHFSARNKKKFLKLQHMRKACPLQFYSDCIRYFLENISSNVKFTIFSDCKDKSELASRLRESFSCAVDIEPYEIALESDSQCELNEILMMSSMDGIIKPVDSTFSIVPLYLNDYKFCMYPKVEYWEGDSLVVQEAFLYNDGKAETINLR